MRCVVLVLIMMSCVANEADGGNTLSLDMGRPATICRGSTSWLRRDCQVSRCRVPREQALHWDSFLVF